MEVTFDASRVNEYVYYRKFEGRMVDQDSNGRTLPSRPVGWTRVRNSRGAWTRRDANMRDMLEQAPKAETKIQRQQRELNEIVAEEERPTREAVARISKLHREIASKEKWLKADNLLKESDADLLAQLEASGPDDVIDVKAEARAFAKRLKARGIAMDATADALLAKVFQFQAKNADPGLVLNADNIEKLFDYCDRLGMFEGHVTRPAPAVVPPPAPAPVDPLQQMEAQESFTREGERKARRMAQDLAVEAHRPMFHEFIGHMRSVWKHAMTHADQERCIEFITKYDLPWNAKTYNIVRRQVLGCRTKEEITAQQIEADSRPTGSWSMRQDYAARRRELDGTV